MDHIERAAVIIVLCQKIADNPNNAENYFNRGLMYSQDKKDHDKAITDYNKAIQLAPNLAIAYFNRGALYLEKENFEQCTLDFQNAVKYDSTNDEYKNNLEKILQIVQERDRKHQEWLKTDEGQQWQEERDHQEAEQRRQKEKESKEKETKIRIWKIGRIAALLLVLFSIIMFIIILSGDGAGIIISMLISLIFIIPFAVVYFCEGIIKRVIFFIAGIGLGILFMSISAGTPFLNIMSISYITSCILAMINKKDKF